MSPSFPFTTTAQLLENRADDDRTAVLFEDRAISWRTFVAGARVRATVLTRLRRPGPWHVGVLMDNDPEYLALIGGAALTGATVVGINPTRRGAELERDIRATDCQALVVGASQRHLLEGLDLSGIEVLDAESDPYRRLLEEAVAAPLPATAPPGHEHTLLLLFTSGSTGAPKAVICTSGRFAMVAQLNIHDLTADDVAYNAMPMFHGNALLAAFAPMLAVGGTFATRPRFSASGFLPDVLRFKATYFNYVGRALSYVLAQPASPEESGTLLRLGFGTEASLQDRAAFERRYGCRIVESYGASEGVGNIVDDGSAPAGSLGRPHEGSGMEIVDAAGRRCPVARIGADGRLLNAAEAVGEIVVRGGAAQFSGYYNNPEAMAAKVRDGDYHTGDLAYCDADGNYWFAGRTSDWIRVDSENFAAAPVERIVARFPGVATAVVYAVADPRTGDQVMASLLMFPGQAFDAAAFAEFLAAQPDLGTKWRPTLVRVVDDLPLTATGKVDKQPLRAEAWTSADPTWLWDGSAYRPFTAEDRAAREAAFAEHGRIALLP